MEAPLQPGAQFEVHFVWQLPEGGDYVRAIFQAEVLAIIDPAQRYLVRLKQFLAGRQESPEGIIRSRQELAHPYWERVVALAGRKITLAWEATDGRPLHLRLATLTGEHDFFHRFPD